MIQEFGISIARGIGISQLPTSSSFPHSIVIDLRYCAQGKAAPINEGIFRRLRNLMIPYHQQPLDLAKTASRQENLLIQTITDNRGHVLVLTDQIQQMVKLCEVCLIPILSTELYVVKDGPKQMNTPNKAGYLRGSGIGRLRLFHGGGSAG